MEKKIEKDTSVKTTLESQRRMFKFELKQNLNQQKVGRANVLFCDDNVNSILRMTELALPMWHAQFQLYSVLMRQIIMIKVESEQSLPLLCPYRRSY